MAPLRQGLWALAAVITHSRWNIPTSPLRRGTQTLIGTASVNRLYYAYARHALVTAFRLTGVKSGDSILLPGFICRDVLASIRAVDAIPIFYHVDDDLQFVSHDKLEPAAALLAVNYFGFPADIKHIRDHLPNPNTAIIEDNAHGWLSLDEEGVPLGTRTSVGVTSFRKTIRSYDGAMLEWRDDETLATAALHPPLPMRTEILPMSHHLRQMISAIDRHTSLSLMNTSRSILRSARSFLGRPPIDPRSSEEFELPVARAIHKSSLARMSSTSPDVERHRRQEAFRQCQEFAANFNIKFPRLKLTAGTSPQGFPFYAHHGAVERFTSSIARNRLGEIVTWPSLPSRSSIPISSPLRNLRLVNFL